MYFMFGYVDTWHRIDNCVISSVTLEMNSLPENSNQKNIACNGEPFALVYPGQNELIMQHTPEQDEFSELLAHGHGVQRQDEWLAPRRQTQPDLSLPMANVFKWRRLVDGVEAHGVVISENPEFQGLVFHFPMDKEMDEALVHSLKTNATYYWRVVGTDGQSRPVSSSVSWFRTADEVPRWVRVEGVSNVRDMGGWKVKDGRRVRQGLVYRGGEMRCHMTATAEGLRFVEAELGVKSLLDLRGQNELAADPTHGSALSPRVRWYNTPVDPYADCATDASKSNYAKAFRICLDPANLPLYTHCWGGADRTGTLIFLLNGALGVPEEELVRDYELTSLAIWGTRSHETEQFKGLLTFLESIAPGETMQAKAIAYWKSAGITDAELSRLQELFLEK